MKKTILYVVLGCLFLILFTRCDRRKIYIPFDPMTSYVDAKYLLSFCYDNFRDDNYYFVALRRIPKHGYSYSDSDNSKAALCGYVKVEIGDTLVAMQADQTRYYRDYWISDISYQLTGNQEIELKIDNNTIVKTHINALNKVKVSFPVNYNYLHPITLNWTFEKPNNYQFIGKEQVYSNEETEYYYQPLFVKQINNTFLSYVIPSKPRPRILNIRPNLVNLFVEEVNFKIVKNTAIMVYQRDGQIYGIDSDSKTCINPDKLERISDIANIISRAKQLQE